jgi:hypothetical protein
MILCPNTLQPCYSSGCYFERGYNKICTNRPTIATDNTMNTNEPTSEGSKEKPKKLIFWKEAYTLINEQESEIKNLRAALSELTTVTEKMLYDNFGTDVLEVARIESAIERAKSKLNGQQDKD